MLACTPGIQQELTDAQNYHNLQFCLAFVNRNLKFVSVICHNYFFPELFGEVIPVLHSYGYSSQIKKRLN